MINNGKVLCFFMASMLAAACLHAQDQLKAVWENESIHISAGGKNYLFQPVLTLLYSEGNPELSLRGGGIRGVSYNIPTWKTYRGKKADLRQAEVNASMAGDGFDEKILKGETSGRTSSQYDAANVYTLRAESALLRGDTVYLRFPYGAAGQLSAYILLNSKPYPILHFQLVAKKAGWFSVGYSGAPGYSSGQLSEIWQPLIWQERRFPDKPYLTMSYRSPIPTTLVYDGHHTVGVVALPSEYPFDPLPLFTNSRFGIMLRNDAGKMQPQLYAPVLGGTGSNMQAGDSYSFSMYLLLEAGNITETFEKVAHDIYGFHDYRHNDISSLNATLDRITEYAISPSSLFIDSLKGCAYSTDVPGAVKNVSSLNPLELAVVMDDSRLFEKRAFPIMEFMLSREKFLFSLDSLQKIQSPSRKLDGPVAPLSELVSLYNIFGRSQKFLLQMARETFHQPKIRNLSEVQKGDTWWNMMYLYKATGEYHLLEKAKKGADEYIKKRVVNRSDSFNDSYSGHPFFWTAFSSRWMELLQLYEITREPRYLLAAHDGARHFAMFTWMSPAIPDSFLLVNKGGKAPMYWYLKQSGHKQMYYPEEWAPAWRLSAMGLTAESSGTSSGHRAIFMSNFAPWMLRTGYYTKDTFLMNIAKASVIGRYRNFPGYHINTARTTAYEKVDFPYHGFMDQSVNSFHYNHIMPMASMLLDYLITDVFVRSKGAISFPAEYIEGYAYLRSNFYGSQPGIWYKEDSVQLWMPRGLLHVDNVELNYISGRKDNKLFIAFTNQSSETVACSVEWDTALVQQIGPVAKIRYWQDGRFGREQELPDYSRSFPVKVCPNGITVVEISGVKPKVKFQDKVLHKEQNWHNDHRKLKFGNARVMIFNLGAVGKRAYIYLQEDDNTFRQVSLKYRNHEGKSIKVNDNSYPFEFTVPLDPDQKAFRFNLEGERTDGRHVKGDKIKMKGF